MKVSLAAGAEQELVEGARFYAREANAELGHAFISEFERSATLLLEQSHLGAVWRGSVRRLPLRRFPYSIVYYVRESVRFVYSPLRIRGASQGSGAGERSSCASSRTSPNKSIERTSSSWLRRPEAAAHVRR